MGIARTPAGADLLGRLFVKALRYLRGKAIQYAVNPSSKVFMADTTLRDGEQSPGASLDIRSKLRIAHALADAGLDIIDAGFPACSPGEEEAVRQIATEVRNPTITCLSRVKKEDIDASARALKPAKQCGITLFLGIPFSSLFTRRRCQGDVP
ncbi:MAG TPA: hypothetical protein PKH07_03250, partial [bacterium]|nr:hypothetical protein [bacterium]